MCDKVIKEKKQKNNKYKTQFNGYLLVKVHPLEKGHTGVPTHICDDFILKLCCQFMGVYFLIMLHSLFHVFFSMHLIQLKMFLKDLEIIFGIQRSAFLLVL